MPKLEGGGHVVLLVTDLAKSVEWYRRVFGFMIVREGVKEGGFVFSSLLHPESFAFVGLAQLETGTCAPFDVRRVGIQHYGYHVPEISDLTEWAKHFESLQISHSGVLKEGYGRVIRFSDPDDIVLEVFWADRRFFAYRLAKAMRQAAQSGVHE